MTAMKQIIKTISAAALAAGIAFAAGAAPATAVMAEELTRFDQTKIEDDLKDVDLTGYGKNKNGRHQLIDGSGFMEYAYSSDSTVAEDYFGIYFYVYNPTEREVSTRAGANVVNMAVSYDAEGEPTEYANCALTVLDYTDNHRFYKFKLTNSAGAYDRAKAYASAHDGVRRYDIAGIQLWFSGDANATDEFPLNTERGVTYRCTGFGKGCGADKKAESTLQIATETMDTISLNVEHTFWRTGTSSLGEFHKNQLDTVYFTVPDRYFEEYGKLQRIMAEWYEFKLKPALIVNNDEWYNGVINYTGTPLPKHGTQQYYNENLDYAFGVGYEYSISGAFTTYETASWNIDGMRDVSLLPCGSNRLQTLYLLFSTKGEDIDSYDPYADVQSQGGIMRNSIENYIYSYNRSFESGTVNVKETAISADLFERDIDESRKVNNASGIVQSGFDGISRYDFDIDADIQEMISWDDTDPSWWENVEEFGFWDALFGKIPDETGRKFAPIYFPKQSDFSGTPENISDELMCQVSDVEKIRTAYETAEAKGETLVFFRFATSDYYAEEADLIDYSDTTLGAVNIKHGQAYYAQQTIFLNFDIIQLTFNKEGVMTVIPVVSDPIDIINPYTPPDTVHGNGAIDWIFIAVLGVVVVACVLGLVLVARMD